MSDIRTVVVIPARYASTRFPGKVLANLAGKPMIQHVFERARASKADDCLIAADDQRVIDACAKFGARAIMTDPALPSGSDRIAAALKGIPADIIINVQNLTCLPVLFQYSQLHHEAQTHFHPQTLPHEEK